MTGWPAAGPTVERYLERIGSSRPSTPDLDSLRDLQHKHLVSVPFENLSIHLDEPIVLEPARILDKLVVRNRGGFCYELNGAFALLLGALGYRVTLLQAQPYGADGPGPPFDHLALQVDLDEPWLVEVGFGSFSTFPLRLGFEGHQADPAGTFSLAPAGPGHLDASLDGQLQYRLDLTPRKLAEFEPMCQWQQTAPESHFRRSLVCSRLTAGGRVTLSGDLLIETTEGQRRETKLETEREILAAYRTSFGIDLDRVPAVAP